PLRVGGGVDAALDRVHQLGSDDEPDRRLPMLRGGGRHRRARRPRARGLQWRRRLRPAVDHRQLRAVRRIRRSRLPLRPLVKSTFDSENLARIPMRTLLQGIALTAALVALANAAEAQGFRPLKRCARDAVVSGTVCMDKYEASVWRVPDAAATNAPLVKKIQQGRANLADLLGAGATPLGAQLDDYAPCADSGQNCTNDVYAVSLPGVIPSAYLTWFQAQAACRNSRKRLPSNAEWQAAVAGSPDPGPDNGTTDCNTLFGSDAV